MEHSTIPVDQAQELCRQAFVSSGATGHNGDITARALVRAEIDGQVGHGLSRVPSYAAQLKTGKVHGGAVPVIEEVKAGLVRVDAGYGFAYPAIEAALPQVIRRAKDIGIAAAALYHSHHFGVAGHPCEDLAREGLIGFVYGNTPKAIAPHGAGQPVLGTNPIAFAAPLDEEPLVIDFALSTVARGKILAARQQGRAIPEGWALGPDGKPTTDPTMALAGSMVPIGGAKGAALALMVEVMSACLAGAALGTEASSLFEGSGEPPDLGQVILAIDGQALSGGRFHERIRDLAAVYGQIEGARLPGSKRLANRKQVEQRGLVVSASLLADIRELI